MEERNDGRGEKDKETGQGKRIRTKMKGNLCVMSINLLEWFHKKALKSGRE